MLALVALSATALAGCPRRQVHLSRPDGGSAVVVVDRQEPAPQDAAPVVPTADEREPNDTRAAAQSLTPGQALRGLMNASTAKRGDVDYFRLVVEPSSPAGATPALVAPPRPPPPPPPPTTQAVASQPAPRPPIDRTQVAAKLTGVPGIDLALDVLNEKGELLQGVNDGRAGAGETIPNLGLTPGVYFVRVRQVGKVVRAAESQPYLLTVTTSPLAPGDEIEPNGKPAWATELLPGGEATGIHGWRRDEDWYRVPLGSTPDGAMLRVDLQGVPGVSASVTVRDSIQTKIADARGGRGDRLALRALAVKKGEPHYYVVVRADSGQSPETRYALRLALDLPGEPTEIEPNDDRAHATPLDGPQGALAGYVASPGDADWFRLTTSSPSRARVEVICPERIDVKLAVHDAAGAELWRVDDGKRREPETLVDVPVNGSVFVRLAARRSDANPDEPYRLTWKLEPDDGTWEREPNNSLATANPWPADAALRRGYLHPRGDLDTFRVLAPTDRQTRLRAAVRPLPRLNLALSLLEAAEPGAPAKPTVVAETKAASPDAERVLEATLTPGKTYYLQVRDASGKASNPRDAYTVTLTVE